MGPRLWGGVEPGQASGRAFIKATPVGGVTVQAQPGLRWRAPNQPAGSSLQRPPLPLPRPTLTLFSR
jgi:hypothetical protein